MGIDGHLDVAVQLLGGALRATDRLLIREGVARVIVHMSEHGTGREGSHRVFVGGRPGIVARDAGIGDVDWRALRETDAGAANGDAEWRGSCQLSVAIRGPPRDPRIPGHLSATLCDEPRHPTTNPRHTSLCSRSGASGSRQCREGRRRLDLPHRLYL